MICLHNTQSHGLLIHSTATWLAQGNHSYITREAQMTETLEFTRIAPIYTIMHRRFGQICYRHNVFSYNASVPESRPGVDAVVFDADA